MDVNNDRDNIHDILLAKEYSSAVTLERQARQQLQRPSSLFLFQYHGLERPKYVFNKIL